MIGIVVESHFSGIQFLLENGYGITGGVYRARYKFHSHQSINWASSVNTAAANSQPGDIIEWTPGPGGAAVDGEGLL